MSRTALVAAIGAIFTALVLATPAFGHDSYREINSIASWLALRPVRVLCLTPEESQDDPTIIYGAEAYVGGTRDIKGNWHPGSVAVFKHGYCETLLAVQRGDASAYTSEDIALAALILTHEAGHLRGHRWSEDEARTECWAIRHVGYVFARLGITEPAARQLLVAEAVEIHNGLSDGYRLPDCVLPGKGQPK